MYRIPVRVLPLTMKGHWSLAVPHFPICHLRDGELLPPDVALQPRVCGAAEISGGVARWRLASLGASYWMCHTCRIRVADSYSISFLFAGRTKWKNYWSIRNKGGFLRHCPCIPDILITLGVSDSGLRKPRLQRLGPH